MYTSAGVSILIRRNITFRVPVKIVQWCILTVVISFAVCVIPIKYQQIYVSYMLCTAVNSLLTYVFTTYVLLVLQSDLSRFTVFSEIKYESKLI